VNFCISLYSSIIWTFYIVGGEAKDLKVTFQPDPPKRGQELTIIINGKLGKLTKTIVALSALLWENSFRSALLLGTL